MSTPFYDLNYSPSFNIPSELDDSMSSSIVQNRSDSSSSTICPNSSIIEKDKDEYDCGQEVEETNFLAQEDENKQQQQILVESQQQESTKEGGKKFYDMRSVKWMSSKMRLTKKRVSSGQTMASSPTNYNPSIPLTRPDSPQISSMDEDDDDHSSSCSLNSKVRACSDCNTTKTPLWRSGPKGPKSLCNACGIRQRKARRAMAATSGGLLAMKSTSSGRNSKVIKEKISGGQFKNGCRPGRPAMKKKPIRFDEFSMMSLSKISALHQAHVFPQEEKEAAILLMALSYGSLLRS